MDILISWKQENYILKYKVISINLFFCELEFF